MSQIANYSYGPEDLPNQEEVELYLRYEDTENPFTTNHIFHDDVTNDSMIEIVANENIEESFEIFLVDNLKNDEEEVELDLVEDISEHTEQPSFTDPIFHDDVTNDSMIDIVATENIEESFETCLVDNSKDGEKKVDINLFEDTECHTSDHIFQRDSFEKSIKDDFEIENPK